MQDKINQMLGITLDNRYRIDEKIGVGGMAVVYKGKDLLLGRTVAIKILHQNFANDDEFVSRFKREAQSAGKLNHPNIVSMYDVGMDQGYNYIVMEYVEGVTLKEYITSHKQLSIDEAVKIAINIGEGLEHAHTMGIVHCDIKPHNIIITNNGRAKVTDFGIARAINASNTMMVTTSVMGSAHYLSPEQASGKGVGGSTDIYSLGVVLYEMLTGRVPYEGESAISVAIKHVREKLTPPSQYNSAIPSLLESAVVKALAKNPSDRFASISDMVSDLRLSQGFVHSRSSQMIPHDFATQMIPTITDEDLNDNVYRNYDEHYEEETSKKSAILAKLSIIPQRYIIVGAIAAFLIAFLGAFLSFGNFWSNATVTVPNVVGKQVTVAKHLLEDNHLRVSTSEVSNPDVPAGQVISQNPEAGSEVKEQRTIHLVVSKGPGEISMPSLTDLTIEQAKTKLKELGLALGKISTAEETSKDDGIILAQDPAASSKISKGTVVNVTVNKKKVKKVSVPSVIGMTLKDARAALEAAGLSVAQVNGSLDEKSQVTGQNPSSGELDQYAGVTLNTEATKEKEPEKPSSSSGGTKGTVDVTIPAGKQNQELRIVVSDNDGKRTIYEGTKHPGDRVVKSVSGSGDVRILIYLNGALVQDQSL